MIVSGCGAALRLCGGSVVSQVPYIRGSRMGWSVDHQWMISGWSVHPPSRGRWMNWLNSVAWMTSVPLELSSTEISLGELRWYGRNDLRPNWAVQSWKFLVLTVANYVVITIDCKKLIWYDAWEQWWIPIIVNYDGKPWGSYLFCPEGRAPISSPLLPKTCPVFCT